MNLTWSSRVDTVAQSHWSYTIRFSTKECSKDPIRRSTWNLCGIMASRVKAGRTRSATSVEKPLLGIDSLQGKRKTSKSRGRNFIRCVFIVCWLEISGQVGLLWEGKDGDNSARRCSWPRRFLERRYRCRWTSRKLRQWSHPSSLSPVPYMRCLCSAAAGPSIALCRTWRIMRIGCFVPQ